MSRNKSQEQFQQSLARLETCLETPRVPGELPSWLSVLQDTFSQFESLLRQQVHDVHVHDFGEIGDQDPGLLTRVEQLKAEDAQIADDLAQLARRVKRASAAAERIEPNERQLDNVVSDLVEQGLAFVLRVRKQETAITTWLLEAFDRDRGTAD